MEAGRKHEKTAATRIVTGKKQRSMTFRSKRKKTFYSHTNRRDDPHRRVDRRSLQHQENGKRARPPALHGHPHPNRVWDQGAQDPASKCCKRLLAKARVPPGTSGRGARLLAGETPTPALKFFLGIIDFTCFPASFQELLGLQRKFLTSFLLPSCFPPASEKEIANCRSHTNKKTGQAGRDAKAASGFTHSRKPRSPREGHIWPRASCTMIFGPAPRS